MADRDIVIETLTARIRELEDWHEQDCEDLFMLFHAAAEWGDDEVEDVLTRWRARRGERAMSGWSWWAREAGDDDRYRWNAETWAGVIAEARRDGFVGALDVVEACDWADEIDIEERSFAQTRNFETGVNEPARGTIRLIPCDEPVTPWWRGLNPLRLPGA